MTIVQSEPTGPARALLEAKRGLVRAERSYAVEGVEIRAAADPNSTIVNFYGHASVTAKSYEMYGGPDKGGWNETVDAGAFKRTLDQSPDVAFLLNHTGMPLARTKEAKNLHLVEDAVGLQVKAELDTRVSLANDIAILMEKRVLTEMSFAFRVVNQRWLDVDGQEVPWWDTTGIDRHISEVNINKGDVSIVTYGANPHTDAGLRGLPSLREFAGALSEVRAGATLSAATRSTLQEVLDAIAGADENIDDAQDTLSALLGVPNPDPEGLSGGLSAMHADLVAASYEVARKAQPTIAFVF